MPNKKPKIKRLIFLRVGFSTGLLALLFGIIIIFGAFKVFNLKSANYDEFRIEAKSSNSNSKLSLEATKSGDYWVYVRTYNRYAIDPVSNAGRSKRGDVVEIMPVSEQLPSATEQAHWAIFKVNGLTNEEIEKYIAPWEEGATPLAYRRYKFNIDKLALNIGINNNVNASDFKPQLALKTKDDLLAYEQGRQQFSKYHKIKTLAWQVRDLIFPHSLAAQQTETSTINKTGQDYDTLTLWEDATDYDLTASNTGDGAIEIAEGYSDDGVLNDQVNVSGAVTDAGDYRKITAAMGERHNGKVDNSASPVGFTIDVGGVTTRPILLSENYAVAEWSRVRNWSGNNVRNGIAAANTVGNIIRNNIVHNGITCNQGGCSGIYKGNSSTGAIYNNIVANISGTGTLVSGIYALRGLIYNNTVYNITNAGAGEAFGFDGGGGSNPITLINNIATNCATEPFDGGTYNASTDYNACDVASCTSVGGTHNLNSLDSDDLYADKANGDLHLKAGAPVIDAGADLSAAFTNDIDNGARDNSWDIGADEYNTSGGGSDDGKCPNGQTRPCGTTDVGVCEYGVETCANGAWGACVGAIEPTAEVCGDSLDNDCDGSMDENCNDNSNHPRIWLTIEKIVELKAKKTANTAQWQKLQYYADHAVPIGLLSPGDRFLAVQKFALAYLLEDDPAKKLVYGNAAVYWLNYIIDNYGFSTEGCSEMIIGMSLGMDWIYNFPAFNTRKAEYIAWLVDQAEQMNTKGIYTEIVGSYAQRGDEARLIAGYVLLGDSDKAQGYIDYSLPNLLPKVAYMNKWYKGGGYYQGENYAHHFGSILQTSEMLKSLSITDPYTAPGITFLEDRLKYLIYMAHPTLYGTRVFRSGDFEAQRNFPDRVRAQIFMLSNIYYDTYGKYGYWLINNVDDLNTNLLSDKDYFNISDMAGVLIDDIISYDPNKSGENVNNLPLAYNSSGADGAGHIIMRSDWDWDNPFSTWIGYTCGNWYGGGHQNLDQASFQLYSHEGDLAIKAGEYDGNGVSNACRNWSGRTVSANSILVYDPNEYWDNSVRGGEYTSYGNDGGQRSFDNMPQVLSGGVADSETYRQRLAVCTVKNFKSTADYDYIYSDPTMAYNNPTFSSDPGDRPPNSPKISKFTRQFVYLRGANEYIVIFDDVVSMNASFKKSWLLHFVNKPILNGSETVIAGTADIGITESTDSTIVTASEGNGKLFSKTLLPENSKITKIGGGGLDANGYTQWMGGSNRWYSNDYIYGSYRIEVSPQAANLKDNFLHVLHPTSSSGSMPLTTLIVSSDSKMKGALILDSVNPRVAMFSVDGTSQTTATYVATYDANKTGKHLLANMATGTYDIYKNSVKITSATVGSDGALSFDSLGGSTFQVAMTGELPVCPDSQQITSTCLCGGTSYSTGYCCSGVHQEGVCPQQPPACTLPQILCGSSCFNPASVCSQNSDCNDNNSSTTDACINPGTCNVSCSNQGVPLQITFGGVSNITTASAIISWTTSPPDQPANSIVEYGLTSSYGSPPVIDNALTSIHTVNLTGLQSNTTYHFRVSSMTANGNSATGVDRALTTAALICTENQTRSCGPNIDVGICEYGSQTCSNNAWGTCSGEVMPTDEICGNSLDDDCDNSTDEGCTPTTCSDNTAYGQCSVNKPKYCDNGTLIYSCSVHNCGCPSGQTCQGDGACLDPNNDNGQGDGAGGAGSSDNQVDEGNLGTFSATKGVAINVANSANNGVGLLLPNFLGLRTAFAKSNTFNPGFWQSLTFWRNLFSIVSFIATIALIVFLFFFFFSIIIFIHRTKDKFGYYPNPKLVLTFIFRHPFYSLRHLQEKRRKKAKIIPDPYHYWTSQTATVGFYGTVGIVVVKIIVILLLLNVYTPTKVLADVAYNQKDQSVNVNDQLTYRLTLIGDASVVSPQSFSDPLPVGLDYVPNSLVVGEIIMTDECDSDQACYNTQTKTIEFKNISMNVNAYFTGKVNGSKSPITNVALNVKVANLVNTIAATPEEPGGNIGGDDSQNQGVWWPERRGDLNLLGEQLSLGNINRSNRMFLSQSAISQITDDQIYNAALFVTYGLTSDGYDWRVRLGVYDDFLDIFKKMPTTEQDFEDLALMMSSHKLKYNVSKIAEAKALIDFIKIYRRLPNFKNAYDDWAMHYMAYRIRPKSKNMASEKAALKSYGDIYHHMPQTSYEWAVFRAITHTGAKR